jgi:hypothetical protein
MPRKRVVPLWPIALAPARLSDCLGLHRKYVEAAIREGYLPVYAHGLTLISHAILARSVSYGGKLLTFFTVVMHRGVGGRGLGWSFSGAAVAAERRLRWALG